MKKVFLLIISAILIAYVFVSCSKSKDKTTQLTTLQKIQAKWLVDSEIDHYHDDSTDDNQTFPGLPSDYIDFRTDGKAYTSLDGTTDTISYALVGDTSILITQSVIPSFKIQTLTDHVLKLYGRVNYTPTTAYLEVTLNLKK